MNTTPSSSPHVTPTTVSDRPRSDQDQPAGRGHTTGGLLEHASLGSRRCRRGRQCVGARSHRRPGRCRGRPDRGRCDHRHVGRIDGGCPDHQRDTAGRTVCRDPRRGASATGRRRRIGQRTRSASLGAELHGVVEQDHRLCRGCVRHAPQDRRRGTRDGCLRRLSARRAGTTSSRLGFPATTGRNSAC